MNEPRMNRHQRIVHRRVHICGDLVLQTATHLGDGDSEGATDMALLRDGREPEKVLLSGASIAGALRSYLREHLYGYFKEEQAQGLTETLFGGRKSDDKGYQSPLIVNDALATPSTYELRDGVKIDSRTRTATDRAKYDLELIAAGTTFPLMFELAFVYQIDTDTGKRKSADQQQLYEQQLLTGLAAALGGLGRGEIALGMKKHRGFGRCNVAEWKVWDFDLTQRSDLFAWLTFDQNELPAAGVAPRIDADITALIGESNVLLHDARQKITLEATFALEGSILIRAGQDEAVFGPDVVHLQTYQTDGSQKPVVSGTSLAGVLRHRAERIANTLVVGSGETFANHMFGRVGASRRKTEDPGQASRLIVREAVLIEANTNLIQNRVSIDRFTGGAYDGALFSEQPAFAKPETRVRLTVELHDPREGEFGMLLLLLKDLWTGDLPIGGESSIGRGRLHGFDATISENGVELAVLVGDGQQVTLTKGEREMLNEQVTKLATALAQPGKERAHDN